MGGTCNTSRDMPICPTLCITPPTMLTTGMDSPLMRLSSAMHKRLSTPPAKPYIMVVGPANRMPLSSTLSDISINAVGISSMYTAKISTLLLMPSLMPGIPTFSGIMLST